MEAFGIIGTIIRHMAILKEGKLSFEIVFRILDDALWVHYEIFLRWNNESIIRDDLLKRSPSYWSKRSPGALLAEESERDTFLPVIDRVLEYNEADYWVPTEPDIVVAFFPDFSVPFLPSGARMIYESEDHKIEREQSESRKEKNGGKLPGDPITMVAMIDCYNMKGCNIYMGHGPALVLTTTRAKLKRFRNQLAMEWESFKIEQRFDERITRLDSDAG